MKKNSIINTQIAFALVALLFIPHYGQAWSYDLGLLRDRMTGKRKVTWVQCS
jgi:hypothetical protein